MEIINTWEDGYDVYFTVETKENQYVDVKYPDLQEDDYLNSFAYVMECENGCHVYTNDGTGDGIVKLSELEQVFVVDFVKRNAKDFIREQNEYIVSLALNVRLDIVVIAKSFEEAKKKAEVFNGEYNWDSIQLISHPVAINAENHNGVLKDY